MISVGHVLILGTFATLLSACGDRENKVEEAGTPVTAYSAAAGQGLITTEVVKFNAPWAMTFLPDNRLLVTEMAGELRLHDPVRNSTGVITGGPTVVHVDQGGLGDVVLHPQYNANQLVYISYVEAGDGGLGAVVARARLVLNGSRGGALENLEAIWRQSPKKRGGWTFRLPHRLRP